MNLFSWILAAAIAVVFVLAVRKTIRDKKNGSCCGGNCGSCGRQCGK